MKKQLTEELVALAEKITLLKGEKNVSTGELKRHALKLYEKLTLLQFTEDSIFSSEEKQDSQVVKTAVKVEASVGNSHKKNTPDTHEHDAHAPSGLEYNNSEAITEPNTEMIKDIVAQMPPETQEVDDLFADIQPKKFQKNDMETIGGVHFDKLPQFEPVGSNTDSQQDKPKSLNDRLKKGIHIGVNDRHAFIKHLFEGSATDYNRVLSQLNTIKSKEEAFNFVANMVKPDYNNWEGKEEYETRFLAIVENKFE